ncbi:unnamed protein product [Camellia sinensis]
MVVGADFEDVVTELRLEIEDLSGRVGVLTRAFGNAPSGGMEFTRARVPEPRAYGGARDAKEAYLFNDYWEDIGTIRSFFEANLALTAHPRDLVSMKPMYTSRRNLPPTTIDNIKHDTVMLGADDYETDAEIAAMLAEGRVPIGIGECIIDKNARIGKNVVIANSEECFFK